MQFLKIPSRIITDGFWAQMSSAARALYPTLLRFSDGNFCPVYPGSNKLMELTGFKHKSSIRKAREELKKMGLIMYAPGTGRTNTRYFFTFPWIASGAPVGDAGDYPTGLVQQDRGVVEDELEYKQIQISINQHVQSNPASNPEKNYSRLVSLFGQKLVSQALKECELSCLPVSEENLEKILYRSGFTNSWDHILDYLESSLTHGSFELIRSSFLSEQNGILFFSDCLPDHLKVLLNNTVKNSRIIFEPDDKTNETRTLVRQSRI